MSDLISRRELLKHRHKVVEYDEAGFSMDYFAVPVEEIKNAPTVEAVPVVRGEWKYDWLGEYICSNCYERVRVKEVMGEPAWDWCPACGADMRGEKHD